MLAASLVQPAVGVPLARSLAHLALQRELVAPKPEHGCSVQEVRRCCYCEDGCDDWMGRQSRGDARADIVQAEHPRCRLFGTERRASSRSGEGDRHSTSMLPATTSNATSMDGQYGARQMQMQRSSGEWQCSGQGLSSTTRSGIKRQGIGDAAAGARSRSRLSASERRHGDQHSAQGEALRRPGPTLTTQP